MDITGRKITKIAREAEKLVLLTMREEGVGTAEIDLIHALRHQCVHIAQARARGRVNPRFAAGQRLDQHVAAGSADQYVFQRAFSARNGSDHRRPLSRVVAMKAAS